MNQPLLQMYNSKKIDRDVPAAEDSGMEHLTGRRVPVPGWCRSRWAGLVLVGVVFVLAAALSWRRWADVLVDFGMQLYLPWRISEGQVLYRDALYLTGGPLSQYFNALLFKIFGVSFRTLIFANLAITAGLLVLVYRRFLAAADRLTATMICLGIVLVFAFQHSGLIGNYNYVTPYCHEVFHGLVLSILVVAWLSSWVETRRLRYAALAGLGSGLVFLTKPEVFTALMICVGMAFLVVGWFHKLTGLASKSLGVFLVAALVPLLAFFALFLRVEDWQDSARSVAAAWAPLWQSSITRDPFYQWCLGLDAPVRHLEKMVGQFICIVLVTGFYVVAFRRGTEARFKWMKSEWAVWLWLAAPLFGLAILLSWDDCGRSLPLLGLTTCGLIWLNYKKDATGQTAAFPLLWNVFGLALLAKLGVFTRISHYGFALAMPAFAGTVYLFVWLLPTLLERRYQVRFQWFRLTACLVLVTGFVHLFLHSESYYCQKNVPVGRGGDEIMALDPAVDPFHGTVQLALSWIQTNVPPEATLAVLPEGAMINYLSRRVNPTPCLVWVPPVMAVYGQTNMNAAFEASPPDYIVIIARSTAEFGAGYFGYYHDYGTELMRWIEGHYNRVYPAPVPGGNQPFARLQTWKRRAPVLPAGKN